MVSNKKEMEIVILPNGNIRVDVKGFKGKSCTDFVKFLEETLGPITEKKFKPDYYEKDGYIAGTITSGDKQ